MKFIPLEAAAAILHDRGRDPLAAFQRIVSEGVEGRAWFLPHGPRRRAHSSSWLEKPTIDIKAGTLVVAYFDGRRRYPVERKPFTLLIAEPEVLRGPTLVPFKAHGGGRPAGYDWPAYKDAFLARVRTEGVPDKLNVDGWQTQADAARWVQEMATKGGGDEPSDAGAKAYVRRWIAELSKK